MLRPILSLLTLSFFLTACGNDEDLSDTDCDSSTGDSMTDEMSESTGDTDPTSDSTGEEPTTGIQDSPTLIVKMNIASGGFIVFHGAEQLIVMEANVCPLMNAYFTCQVADLVPGGYKVAFLDVAGYQTPASNLVQLDGHDDEVVGDYMEQ